MPKAWSIESGDMVEVTTRRGAIILAARVTWKTAPGLIFVPFHYGEAPANALTNDAFDPVSKIPEYKVSAAKVGLVEKCAESTRTSEPEDVIS